MTARTPRSVRARTRPRWSITALKPVGAAWTTSRPSAMAWSRAAAISWVGTWLVRYDEVLVGSTRSCAPARVVIQPRSRVEDLVGHERPEGAGRGVQDAVAVPGDGVERDAREVGEVLEEPPVRDVLAEGHAVDLLEARHQRARRGEGHDLVAEALGRHRLGDPHQRAWRAAASPARPVASRSGSRRCGCRETPRPRATPPTTGPGPRRARRSRSVAANCAAVTVAGSTSDLRRPRTPPPWTDATRRVRTAGPPSGATAPHDADAGDDHRHHGRAASARRARRRRPGGAARPTPAVSARLGRTHRRRHQMASPAPPSQTRPTSSSGPPRRAAPASGPDAWPRATPPMGRPPKGHVERSASARTMAPASAAVRPGPRRGTTAQARAGARDSTAMSTKPP